MTDARCPRCGAAGRPLTVARDRTGGVPARLMRCTSAGCGVGWTVPDPTPRDGAPAAPGLAPGGVLGRLARGLAAAELRSLLPDAGPGMLVMDVGAGAGLRSAALLDLGARVLALEPDAREARRAAAALGGRAVVRAVGLLDVEPDAVRADAVLCWHVLEHLDDPDGALARMRDALRPGGTLVVAVPNAGGAEARLLGGRWHGWEPRRHRWHLDRAALRRLLASAGFTQIAVRARGGWLPAMGPACSLAPELDPQLARSPLPGLALATALTPVAGALRALGRGPQLVGVARRPEG